MRIKIIVCIVILIGLTNKSHCINVQGSISDASGITVTIRDIKLPGEIENELDNGLPNRIDAIVNLLENGTIVNTAFSSRIINYDLWDDNYVVQIVERQASDNLVFATKKELLDYLSTIRVTGISIPRKVVLPADADVHLSAEIVFNPVHQERIERIKEWLDKRGGYNRNATESSLDMSASTQVLSGSHIENIKSHGPRFQKLFDQILEQYMKSGDGLAAQWRSGKFEIPIESLTEH